MKKSRFKNQGSESEASQPRGPIVQSACKAARRRSSPSSIDTLGM